MTRRPYRSELYLKFIRSLPCCVCGTHRRVEAGHTGVHGLGQRADDTDAIPLCVRHHRIGPHSYHHLGRRRFEQFHELDIRAIIRKLNEKPRVNIGNGSYTVDFGLERYELGALEQGIDHALRTLRKLQHQRLTEKIEEGQYA